MIKNGVLLSGLIYRETAFIYSFSIQKIGIPNVNLKVLNELVKQELYILINLQVTRWNLAETEQDPPSLRSGTHSAARNYLSCQGRETIDSPTQLYSLQTTMTRMA